ncbi:hypothetical protein [uncultured Tenacibaculum sp.]|uniref:hypothetical protein n=1 Tax=uncultured Tenacibaculum sp. TaxID=174713 RepID=UPI0026111C6B|nr:hypothetical protein [uncultured Tenacibaculum sp.]
MKKVFLTFILIFPLFLGFSQEKEDISIFKNTKNWKQEIIKFPVKWAPKLKLKGFEELLFTPHWSDSKHNEFWSLIMGWKIETSAPLKLKEIESGFKSYFDGLMIPNHWATKFPAPKVNLKKGDNGFIGTMVLFDGFHTGKLININIQGEQQFSKQHKKSIVTFRLSPKDFHHEVWKNLNEIQLKESNNSIIQLDASWGKEIFSFPISFAKNIDYKGIAEVRFPPKGWRNPEHENFWSYTYAWDIELDRKITVKELTSDLEKYFDGLNGVGRDKAMDQHKTVATITKIKSTKSINFFIGTVKTYDRFATHKPITLNVFIESITCDKQQKTVLFFKLSPKPFEHKTWKTLGEIHLTSPICK